MLASCNYEPAAAERYATYWPVGAPASEEVAELVDYMHAEGYLHVFIVDAPGSRYVEAVTNEFRQAAQSQATSDRRERLRRSDAGLHRPGADDQAHRTAALGGLHGASAADCQSARGLAQGTSGAGDAVRHLRHGWPFTFTGGSAGLENTVLGSYGFARENRAAQRFSSDYSNQFGRVPVGSLPGLGFETVRLLAQAAGQAHTANPSAIEQALARGITLKGVALGERRYAAGNNHNPIAEVGVEKIIGRSFEPLFAGSPHRAAGG